MIYDLNRVVVSALGVCDTVKGTAGYWKVEE